eukprot:CAMPEP_0170091298 /NCGR_PEP_ID=MMETSP0019_2-20121128/24947_1 /TAXON_ID=98059 /ORGANISM="Dinobryon sp., Strain UTEXLB2267" /LENGTH=151 /DNA_ID=CAMNT_0010311151 /DNA_START=547 /DNA_END=1001 /DNA_ORIENTATION=+
MENEDKFLQDIQKSLYVGSWSENSLPNNVLYVEEEENTPNVNEGILHESLPAIDAEIMKGVFLSGKREAADGVVVDSQIPTVESEIVDDVVVEEQGAVEEEQDAQGIPSSINTKYYLTFQIIPGIDPTVVVESEVVEDVVVVVEEQGAAEE